MKFNLVDRITQVEPGQSLESYKVLSLAEEYLQDHFPRRPVMPGVMMVEAMVQAGAWLVRLSQDYACSIVILREARNVRYGRFVRPGDRLEVRVEMKDVEPGLARMKGRGVVDGQMVVSGMLELECFNVADRDPGMADIDRQLVQSYKDQFRTLNFCSGSGPSVPDER